MEKKNSETRVKGWGYSKGSTHPPLPLSSGLLVSARRTPWFLCYNSTAYHQELCVLSMGLAVSSPIENELTYNNFFYFKGKCVKNWWYFSPFVLLI